MEKAVPNNVFNKTVVRHYRENLVNFKRSFYVALNDAKESLEVLGIDVGDLLKNEELQDGAEVKSIIGNFSVAFLPYANSAKLSTAIAFTDVPLFQLSGERRLIYSVFLFESNTASSLLGCDKDILSAMPYDLASSSVQSLICKVASLKLALDGATLQVVE